MAREQARQLQQARVELARLLRELAVSRCMTPNGTWAGAEYNLRYQTDAAFRQAEIERTRHRKLHPIPMESDGTLTNHTTRLMLAQARVCTYCRESFAGRRKTIDHVIPRSRGGRHSIDNVVVCCANCNSRKGTKTLTEWATT